MNTHGSIFSSNGYCTNHGSRAIWSIVRFIHSVHRFLGFDPRGSTTLPVRIVLIALALTSATSMCAADDDPSVLSAAARLHSESKIGPRPENTGPLGRCRLVDVESYITDLDRDQRITIRQRLKEANVSLAGVVIARVALKGRFDIASFENCRSALAAVAQRIAVVAARISGSEEQKRLAESLPQQERNNVLAALLNGERAILVIVETHSAKPRSVRPIFRAVIRLVEQGQVNGLYASAADRLSRWPAEAVRLVEALQMTGTILYRGGSGSALGQRPLEAILLIMELVMGSMHVIMIADGLRRVWRSRLDQGQWVNKGHLLIGLELDQDERPFVAEKSRPVLRAIYRLIADDVPLAEVRELIRAEYPEWCAEFEEDNPTTGRRGTELTDSRLERLVATDVFVSGRQVWGFNEERQKMQYPQLAGIIDESTYVIAAARFTRRRMARQRRRRTPWEMLIHELLFERGHPVDTLIRASGGAMRWDASGTWSLVCPKCSCTPDDEDWDGAPGFKEVQPEYGMVQLVDGKHADIKLPKFKCGACGRTTIPLNRSALAWLLTDYRILTCPRCQGAVSYEKRETQLTMHTSASSFAHTDIVGVCKVAHCGFDFPVPARFLPPRIDGLVGPRRRSSRTARDRGQQELSKYVREVSGDE